MYADLIGRELDCQLVNPQFTGLVQTLIYKRASVSLFLLLIILLIKKIELGLLQDLDT